MPSDLHNELVERAGKWLRGTMRCPVVATEIVSRTYEVPDAIGFNSDASFVVEVKVSRNDFRADLKKPRHRNPERGMGNYRWFMTPPGLVTLDELPEGWGLLEASNGKVEVKAGYIPRGIIPKRRPIPVAHRFKDVNLASERTLLVSIHRRAMTSDSAGGKP